MLVLAIESATEAVGVALADGDGVIASVSLRRGMRHVEAIAPSIAFVCRRAGASLSEVDVLAVDVGPGLFAGLRAGVGTAKALGFALQVEVAGRTSLDVLAAAALLGAPDLRGQSSGMPVEVVPVVDARRGEVFSARFVVADGREGPLDGSGAMLQIGEVRLDEPGILAERLRSSEVPVWLVGNGALRYSVAFQGIPTVELGGSVLADPPVEVLSLLGVQAAMEGNTVLAEDLAPMYLRDAGARANFTRRTPSGHQRAVLSGIGPVVPGPTVPGPAVPGPAVPGPAVPGEQCSP